MTKHGTERVLSSSKEFQLRRAAASGHAAGSPWILSAQLKTKTIPQLSALLMKHVVCSKPKDGVADSCCVRKSVKLNGVTMHHNYLNAKNGTSADGALILELKKL